MSYQIPVVLFAYSRPEHLKRTLTCLRENNVPLIYAFSDGPKTPETEPLVKEVREVLRQVDWCDIHIVEREKNLGLGKSILTGVTEILQQHDAILVFEDDLICVPGTYQYLCAALEYYKDTPHVMSVTGFTHPLNTPSDIIDQPYFDGRADCLVWGTWAQSWGNNMQKSALELIAECEKKGIDVYKYGAVLPELAKMERKRNTWAVRFTYWHILKEGLCLRPPHSMVEHIGFDKTATNAPEDIWGSPPLTDCPLIPDRWPEPVEHPECSRIWQRVDGRRPTILRKLLGKLKLRRFINIYRHIMQPYYAWVGESPSTRDVRLIIYQIKKIGLKRMLKPYDDIFYKEHRALKPGYQKLAKIIMAFFHPESVCDFGCGNGFIIETMMHQGIRATGIEGSSTSLQFVDEQTRRKVLICDLTKIQDILECELAISTEVAEHLPKKYSEVFISNIARSARKRILFTAAQPGQWGDGHINCQPKEYWIKLFELQGWNFQPNATHSFISQIREADEITSNMPWLVNNFMIFARSPENKQ